MKRPFFVFQVVITSMVNGLIAALAAGLPAHAAEPNDKKNAPIRLTLERAVELGLVYNYALRQARIERKDIEQQTLQAWRPVWPRLDGTASYTRNLAVPNPFAGTPIGSQFVGGGSGAEWVEFNEAREQQGRPEEQQTFDDYNALLDQGRNDAGIVIDPDTNLFLVENQFNLSLVIRQVIFDGALFFRLEGSGIAEELGEVGVNAEALNAIRGVAQAFYGALLADKQTDILNKSVSRTQSTVDETKERVAQGVVPRFQLLTAEVELANLQTNLARAKNDAARAVDDLRLAIGLPPDRPLVLEGELTLKGVDLAYATGAEAVKLAFDQRPDIRQAQLQVERQLNEETSTIGSFFPTINAVVNLSYIGSVPDDRTVVLPRDIQNDPFRFQTRENGFFSDDYWFANVNVGVTLDWNILDGGLTIMQLERDRLATKRARIQLEQARAVVHLEVERSLRELDTARQQIETQQRNRERAELNYEHAQVRVREGVSSQFELRQASQQLDESRFNYLQAIHDFLVARVAYLVAVGTPPIVGSYQQ